MSVRKREICEGLLIVVVGAAILWGIMHLYKRCCGNSLNDHI